MVYSHVIGSPIIDGADSILAEKVEIACFVRTGLILSILIEFKSMIES